MKELRRFSQEELYEQCDNTVPATESLSIMVLITAAS